LFQDGFNYTAGTALAGQGTWVNSAPLIKIGSANLTYSGLPDTSPAGNEVSVTGLSAPSASFSSSPFDTSASSGTVYASFLLDFTAAGGNYTFLGMLPTAGNGGNFTSTYDPIDIASKPVTGGYSLGIRTLGQSAAYAAPVLTLGTANLIVLKYDFAAHKASLFINPTVPGSEPGTAGAVSTGTASAIDLDQFYVRIGGNNQGNYQLDAIRVGTSWVEVVPEPATVTLIGFGVLGLALSRRMRR
jgi:hypothetical protein